MYVCKSNEILMLINFKFNLNPKLYLKDPEGSDLGRAIVLNAICLIDELGFELFNFKKLANLIPTTEASIYRYFENKQKILLYVVDYYWTNLHHQVIYATNNIVDPKQKIEKILDLLLIENIEKSLPSEINHQSLFNIIISDGSKTYMHKEVDKYNKDLLYKPYKDLCHCLELVFLEYNADYKYPKSLASTIIEASHYQYYFKLHLPRLCNFENESDAKEIKEFLSDLIFGALGNKN